MRDNLLDRSLGFQAIGFTIVIAICVTLLQVYSGSDHWAYKTFETAVTRIYWAFLVPLAYIFDKVWEMFATRGQLIEQKIREAEQKGREEGLEKVLDLLKLPQEERERIRAQLRRMDANASNGQATDPLIQQLLTQLLAEIRGLRLDLQDRRSGIQIPPEIADDEDDDTPQAAP